MPKKYTKYWYKEGPEFKAAFLYNLRDDDVRQGGNIPKGSIVQGATGLVAAESEVVGWTGRTIAFKPNRRCRWHEFELPCLVSATVPSGRVPAAELRDSNYAVAAITSDEVKALADQLGIPAVKTSEGAWVINVELARFERQGSGRRATLL